MTAVRPARSGPPGTAARADLLSLLVVVALALVLYSWGLARGLPDSWDPDEVTPPEVLRCLERGIAAGWPPMYAPFHFYVLAGPYLAVRFAASHGLLGLDPGKLGIPLYYVSRGISVLMGLGTIVAAYLTARDLFERRAATLAALAAGLIYPAAYYAKSGNLDMPYVFWFSLSLWFFVRLLRRHRVADYLLFTVAAVLSVTSKDQAYGLYVLAPPVVLLGLRRHRARLGLRTSPAHLLLDPRPVASGVTAAFLFALIHGLLVDRTRFSRHLAVMTGSEVKAAATYARTLAGHAAFLARSLSNLDWCLGTPLLVAGLAGAALAQRLPDREARFAARGALVLALSYYVFFLCHIMFTMDRYFLPIAVVLAVFAGHALDRLSRVAAMPAPVRLCLIGGALGYALLRAVDLDLNLTRDSRAYVAGWVAARTGASPSFALGFPLNRFLPVMPHAHWSKLKDEGRYFDEVGARYLVVNETDTFHCIWETGGPSRYRPLLEGELNYRLLFRYRYRSPLARIEPRQRCFVDIPSNLCHANPVMAVYERTGSRFDWLLARSRGDAERLVEMAAEERRRGRLDLALDLDREASCRAPRSPRAASGLALDAAAAGRWEEAEARIEEALARDPDSPDAAQALDGLQRARARPVPPADLVDGFYAEEQAPEGSFRWTSGCATARLARPADDVGLRLDYRCGPRPTRVSLRVGGEAAWESECGGGESLQALVPLSPELWGQGGSLPLEIVVAEPFVPGAVLPSDDGRELGIQVFFLGLAPAAPGSTPAARPGGHPRGGHS